MNPGHKPPETAHEDRVADAVKAVDERPADRLREPKDEIHHAEEDRNSEEPVEDDPVDLLAEVGLVRHGRHHVLQHSLDERVPRTRKLDVVQRPVVVQPDRRNPCRSQSIAQHALQPSEIPAPSRVDANHRHAKTTGQTLEIDPEVPLLDDVHHRHHNDHRHLKLAHEKRQIEIALEGRRVNHVDVEIGLVRENVIKRNLLVLARRSQRVDAGEIDDANPFSASVA